MNVSFYMKYKYKSTYKIRDKTDYIGTPVNALQFNSMLIWKVEALATINNLQSTLDLPNDVYNCIVYCICQTTDISSKSNIRQSINKCAWLTN